MGKKRPAPRKAMRVAEKVKMTVATPTPVAPRRVSLLPHAETEAPRSDRKLGEVNFVKSSIPKTVNCSICGADAFAKESNSPTFAWSGVNLVAKEVHGHVHEDEWTLCGKCTSVMLEALAAVPGPGDRS